MSTLKPIDILRGYTMKILPTVYEDALSYSELLAKIRASVNILIENNNALPTFIQQTILAYLNGTELRAVLSDVIASFMLNVRNPPEGITPAVGDGTADDTAAFQGCIDYAYANGGMSIYIPNGVYLVSGLTLKSGVSLCGASRYSCRLVLKGGATKPIIGGTTNNNAITGLTLDGNADIQVNNLDLLSLIGTNYAIKELILNDGHKLLVLDTTAGNVLIDSVICNKATIMHVDISGAATLQASNIVCESLSAIYAETCLKNGVDNATYENIVCKAVCPYALTNSGDNCMLSARVMNAVAPILDTGTNNTINVAGISSVESMTGTKTINVANMRETISSERVINAATLDENITGAKTVDAASITETVSGIKEINAATFDENITGAKTVDAASLDENITGAKTVDAASLDENITGAKTVDAASITETVSGERTIDAETIYITTTDGAIIDGNVEFTVSPTAPTPDEEDNSTKVATTAFVKGQTIDISNATIDGGTF